MTLSSRIEAASADQQRELLVEAARLIWGWDFCPPAEDPDEWVCRWNRFHRKIEAEAYLDAAMMLVAPGKRRVEFGTYNDGTAWAYVRTNADVAGETDACATEALALAAAAIRAKGIDDV